RRRIRSRSRRRIRQLSAQPVRRPDRDSPPRIQSRSRSGAAHRDRACVHVVRRGRSSAVGGCCGAAVRRGSSSAIANAGRVGRGDVGGGAMDVGAISVVTSSSFRFALCGAGMLLALGVVVSPAYSHPLHTTLTELTIASDGSIQIVVRAFVDDFSAAVYRRTAPSSAKIPTPPDSATARYLGEVVALTDGAGRRAPLVVANVRRTDDLL